MATFTMNPELWSTSPGFNDYRWVGRPVILTGPPFGSASQAALEELLGQQLAGCARAQNP